MSDPVLKVSNVAFSYEETPVLREVSFEVGQGDFLAVVGPNGVGKTTLLKCINKLLQADAGQIWLAGKLLSELKPKDIACLVSLVPQITEALPSFTVEEFVRLGRYPYHTPFDGWRQSDQDAVDQAMADTAIEGFNHRSIQELSGGERQRVLVAAALAQQAGLMLLDEPIGFLDPKHQADMYKLLKRVNVERGVTQIMVTHDINNAALCSSKVLALKEGRVAFFGSTEDFMQEDILRGIYDVSFRFVPHPESGKRMAFQEGLQA